MWKRWISSWLGLKPDTLLLPIQARVSQDVYLKALGHFAASPEGQTVILAWRESYFEALGRRCPSKVPAERSEWLAAHEAMLATRKHFLDQLVQNIDLIEPEKVETKRLRGVP